MHQAEHEKLDTEIEEMRSLLEQLDLRAGESKKDEGSTES